MMEDLSVQVAQNLKRLREDRKLSLEKLAELTGVSKSMLGQIERGDSSPTIATVWKIANGLKVPFTSLLDAPRLDPHVIRAAELRPLLEDNGKYRLFPFFPIEAGRRFEVYALELDPGAILEAEAHPDGTQEFLTVFEGELSVGVEASEYRLAAGDAIRFRADRAHSYTNPGSRLSRLSMVIHYQ
jgi:XRE family transcriptional regulator, regulator of sulfur utilization